MTYNEWFENSAIILGFLMAFIVLNLAVVKSKRKPPPSPHIHPGADELKEPPEEKEVNTLVPPSANQVGGTPEERKELIEPIIAKLATLFVEDQGAYSINVKSDGRYGWMSMPINEASMFAMMGNTDAVTQCLQYGCQVATLAELKEIADLTVDVAGDVRTLTIDDTIIVVQYH